MFKQLGNNLDLLMSRNRLTSTKLARATGIPASTLKKIRCHVNTNPTLSTLIPLAQHFSISLEQLVSGNVLEPGRLNIHILPIMTWEESLISKQLDRRYTLSVVTNSEHFTPDAFALQIENEDCGPFPAGSVVLVEPTMPPNHLDYVITHKTGQTQPTLKQFFLEDETEWIRSVNIAQSVTQVTSEHRILGVILEYRKQYRTVAPVVKKPFLNFSIHSETII